MCIQFVYVNNSAVQGEYQVIIANNRDEFFQRQTKPAECWGRDNSCISGRDLQPGKEGGTWIGLNTESGRIGTLLNVLQNCKPDPDKWGRGSLVVDYIQGSQSPLECLNSIQENAAHYNPFNLLLMNYRVIQTAWRAGIHPDNTRSGSWHSYQYSTASDTNPTEITDSVYGVSNSSMDQPWRKVTYGTQLMADITHRLHSVEQEDSLIKELTALLNNTTCHFPDEQFERQSRGYLTEELSKQRCSIFVDSRQVNYGTRTNTVVLIEKSGAGKYIERTMREPVDVNQIVWDTNVIPFHVTGATQD